MFDNAGLEYGLFKDNYSVKRGILREFFTYLIIVSNIKQNG